MQRLLFTLCWLSLTSLALAQQPILPVTPSGDSATDDTANAVKTICTNPDGTTCSDTVSSGTLSNVTAVTSSTTCIASAAGRRGAVIHNDSTAILYLKYGATASTTSYTYRVEPNGHWVLDYFPLYTGVIDCIWSAANGAARVTTLP